MARLGSLAAYRAQQRARAVGAGLVGKLPLGARVAFLGDSIFAYSLATSADAANPFIAARMQGEMIQALALDPRINIDAWQDTSRATGVQGSNQGVVGNTTAQALARVPDVVALKPGACIVCIGTNNTAYDAAALADVTEIVRLLQAANIRVILCTIRPWNTARPSSGDTQARRDTFGSFNAGIRSIAAAKGCILCDLAAALGAPSEFVYAPSRNFYDDLHLNSYGATPGAMAMVTAIAKAVEPGNVYTRDFWSGGNLLPNPNFTGSAANGETGLSGVVPSGVRAFRPIGGHVSTAVTSLVANAETGGRSLRVTVTPSGTNEYEVFRINRNPGAISVSDLGSKWVMMWAEVELDAWPFWNGPLIGLNIQSTGGTTDLLKNYIAGFQSRSFTARDVNYPLAGRRFIGTMREITRSDATAIVPKIDIGFCPAGATGTGTLTIHRWWAGIVPDPRPAWNVAVA